MAEYVYAQHDFVPEHEDELSFRAGERIEVIERDELYGDGWWKVRSLSSSLSLWIAFPSPTHHLAQPGLITSSKRNGLLELTLLSSYAVSHVFTFPHQCR